MDKLIAILGVILVLTGAGFPIARHVMKASTVPPHKGDIPIGFLAGILGLFLIIQARITSIPTPFGKIQAATEQALADAGDIATLKTQAQTQTATINLVADQATKARTLSETVAGQVTEAQANLAALNAALTTAQATLSRTKQEEDFTMTVLAAESGDNRESFDKLRAIAGDTSNPFADLAAQTWVSVLRAHTSPFFATGFTVPWQAGVDPATLSMDQLIETYNSSPSILRPGLLEYINGRNDLPKQIRLDFLTRVIISDNSLMAMEYAGRYFISLSGQPANLDFSNASRSGW